MSEESANRIGRNMFLKNGFTLWERNAMFARRQDYYSAFWVWSFLPDRAIRSTSWVVRVPGQEVIVYIGGKDAEIHEVNPYSRKGEVVSLMPYGRIPRLFFHYVASQLITNPDPDFPNRVWLPRTVAHFLRELGLRTDGGGVRSDWYNLHRQLRGIKLLHMKRNLLDEESASPVPSHLNLGETHYAPNFWTRVRLWRDPHLPAGSPPFFELSDGFAKRMKHAFPLPLGIIRQLNTAFSIDFFAYIVYRSYNIYQGGKPVNLPVPVLMEQFGYLDANPDSRYKFRERLVSALDQVRTIYPDSRVDLKGGVVTIKKPRHPLIEAKYPANQGMRTPT